MNPFPVALALAGAASPPAGSNGAVVLGSPVQILVLLTSLTVLPALVVSATPFLRITLVLHFLRQALGTQTAPSNQVLLGLALFLTILLMQPVGGEVFTKGWQPYQSGTLSAAQAWEQGTQPWKMYLLKFVREKDIHLFLDATKAPRPNSPGELGMTVVIPAYILSELRAGFQIGAVLFLPFLVIDLVVASLTLSIGMVQLPPVMISAPFKVLLFVLADGWNLVIGSLLKGLA